MLPVFVVEKGAITRIEIPYVEAPAILDSSGDTPATAAGSTTTASGGPPSSMFAAGAVEPNDEQELRNAIGAECRLCEAHLKTLMSGDEESELFKQDTRIRVLANDNPKGVWFSRTRVANQPDGTPINGEWLPVELYDLTKPEVRRHYNDTFIANFESTHPSSTGLRLLVIETVVRTAKLTTMMRYIVYFMREGQFQFQLSEYERLYSVDRAPVLLSEYERLCSADRAAVFKFRQQTIDDAKTSECKSETSIRVISTELAFLVMTRIANAKEPTAEERDEQRKAQFRISQAEAAYRKQRSEIRYAILRDRSHSIIDWFLHLFAPTLLKRMTDAQPHVPDQLLVVIDVRNNANGVKVYLDKTFSLGRRSLDGIVTEAAERSAGLKKMADTMRDQLTALAADEKDYHELPQQITDIKAERGVLANLKKTQADAAGRSTPENELAEMGAKIAAMEKRIEELPAMKTRLEELRGNVSDRAAKKADLSARMPNVIAQGIDAEILVGDQWTTAKVLAKCDPHTQIVIQIVEQGDWQDIGERVEITHTVRVPYETIRKHFTELMLIAQQQQALKEAAGGGDDDHDDSSDGSELTGPAQPASATPTKENGEASVVHE